MHATAQPYSDIYCITHSKLKGVMASLYKSLYQTHDDMLSSKQAESARLRYIEAKQRRLTNQFEDLLELPALSSFLSIQEAIEDADVPAEQDEDSSAPKKRDGFERMRRFSSFTCISCMPCPLNVQPQVQDGTGCPGPRRLEAELPPNAVP
jgi:hypothetical protein